MSQQKGIIDPLLTNVSSAQLAADGIADILLPEIKSDQYTGKLGGYGKGFLRIENSVIGNKGKYRQVESVTRSTTGFDIEGHGLSNIIGKKEFKNVKDPFDAEKDETVGLTSLLQVEKEFGLASQLTNTATITQNTTLLLTAKLSDYTNSDPAAVFAAAKAAVKSGCGAVANTVIMDYDVAEVLRYHPQLLDLLGFKFARPGGLTNEEFAKALGVKKVLIPEMMYNSAKEGAADSMVSIWGKNIIFGVIPDSAQKYQTALGYQVRLNDGQPRKVYKQNVFNPPGSVEILVEDEYDMLLSNVNAAYLIAGAIA